MDRQHGYGWKNITSDSDSPAFITPLVPTQSPRAGLSEKAIHKPLEGDVNNPDCIAISFPVHGIHALFSRIEQDTAGGDEFGVGHLAYGAHTPGVVTCRIFESSQWRICLKKLPGSDSAPHHAGIKVRLSRFINRLGKRPESRVSSRPETAGKNNLCVSLSWIKANEDRSTSPSLSTTITVAIREPGSLVQLRSIGGLDDCAEGCLWSHTEDFTFDNEHPTWCKCLFSTTHLKSLYRYIKLLPHPYSDSLFCRYRSSYGAAIIGVIAKRTNSDIRFIFSYIAAREVMRVAAT
ncbi:hypothetical protein O181_000500 [Austropuccinia psidii MF-1]|uniref:Uncharacterized protein n=1 Tax=Austropuccinia psidii MF-1 TaxID=1389203 RepID=A0A9Q3B951_9BASI|nr:hypothetical protein [Austropuccinia psidii MF-1]